METPMPIASASDDAGSELADTCASFEAASCPKPCSRVFGEPYDAAKQCIGAQLAVACADMRSCDLSVTFAKAPDGRVLVFPSTCVPQGWSVLYLTSDYHPCVAPSCSSFEAGSCPERCRPLLGAPYDAAQQCFGAELAVACADPTVDCGDAMTFAKAPDDRVLLFRSTCVPQGWSVVDPYPTREFDRQCVAP